VPFFRLLTSDGTRIISLYRQNVNGKIQVGYGGATSRRAPRLRSNTWANLQLHVVIAGATSTVEVRSERQQLVYSDDEREAGHDAAAIRADR
jgi:hypothetical protein